MKVVARKSVSHNGTVYLAGAILTVPDYRGALMIKRGQALALELAVSPAPSSSIGHCESEPSKGLSALDVSPDRDPTGCDLFSDRDPGQAIGESLTKAQLLEALRDLGYAPRAKAPKPALLAMLREHYE